MSWNQISAGKPPACSWKTSRETRFVSPWQQQSFGAEGTRIITAKEGQEKEEQSETRTEESLQGKGGHRLIIIVMCVNKHVVPNSVVMHKVVNKLYLYTKDVLWVEHTKDVHWKVTTKFKTATVWGSKDWLMCDWWHYSVRHPSLESIRTPGLSVFD